jgi:hypothetical protein
MHLQKRADPPVQVRVRSFASRNQLAAYPTDRQKGQELEWERRYVTVLGAANKRLYQFRLQTTDKTFEQSPVSFLLLKDSHVLQATDLQSALHWLVLKAFTK